MKVAGLDLGSNTFLCLIAEVEKNKIVNTYSDQVEVVRLGQDLAKTKKFHPDALERAKKTLEGFKKILDQERPERILAMATSAARDAENQIELFKICKNLNIPLEIIPGSKEAQITYQGSISGVDKNKNRLVIDIGGGSTEFILGSGDEIKASKSLDIGCVRLTEKYILNQPTPTQQITAARDHISFQIEQQIKPIISAKQIDEVLAVAGTPTTLAAVAVGSFDINKIDGFQLTLLDLQTWLHELTQMSIDEKIKKGFPAGRADVILIGILILIETLRVFNQDTVVVSSRGIRHGVVLEVASRPI